MAKALQLGRYHLLDRIAFGGMAEIYRAKTFDDEGRVHMVAVKRILSHLARDDEFIKMLVDEAKIASLMEHESIAQVYEFCYAHGEYFIAMEYVDGKDGRTILDRCRAQRRWIPPELCAFIMMYIMRGLHQAHNQTDRQGQALNLIHRDVSPSNVICSYAGEVKLCDFGIAKATLSTVQTRSGVIKGKVKYMSPEQAMGRKLDPRTDIFSGGSVLYEMLTRVPPFLAPNEMELLVLVRETRYTPVRERNPMVPPALEVIVDTAMARKPSHRYQTADEFADALQEYLAVHAASLTRSHLGRFVRQLFAEDIEKELRALEEYVVESAADDEVGVNLIADALGPGADYSKFSPNPTAAHEGELEQEPRDGLIEASLPDDSRIVDPALKDQPTVILDSGELQAETQLLEESRQVSSEVLWQADGAFGATVSPPPEEEEGPAVQSGTPPMGLHEAHTVILELEEPQAADAPQADPAPTEGPGPSDTYEMPTLGGGSEPDAGLEADTPEQSPGEAGLNLHEMPTGEIEETGQASALSQATTEQLEVSDVIRLEESDPNRRVPADSMSPPGDPAVAGPGAPRNVSAIHTDNTALLEVDDLDPDPDTNQ